MRQLAERPPSETVAVEALTELSNALVELEVTNEELTHSNNMLADITAARDLEARRYRDLFQQIPVACIVTDMWGVIQEANNAAGVLLQLASVRLLGKPVSVFVPPEKRREFRERMNQLPLTDIWEARLQLRGGLQIFVQIEVARLEADDFRPPRLYWAMQKTAGSSRTFDAMENLLSREVGLRLDAERSAARLRTLQAAMQSFSDGQVAIPNRVRSLLEPLVPGLAQSISCTFPGAVSPAFQIGDAHLGRFVLEAEIYSPGSPNGQLVARHTTDFTPDDHLVFTCAANAVTAVICNSFNRRQ